jgi:hypothetical protein
MPEMRKVRSFHETSEKAEWDLGRESVNSGTTGISSTARSN